MVSVKRVTKAGWALVVLGAVLAGTRTLAQQPAQGAAAAAQAPAPATAQGNGPPPIDRTDISGDWAVVSNEDKPHRAPGPELGDYTGLPLNDADRQKAEAWDATILSQPERQAQKQGR